MPIEYVIRTWQDITYADGSDNAPADVTETVYDSLVEASDWLERNGFNIDGQTDSPLNPVEALEASWLYNSLDWSIDYRTGDSSREVASFQIRVNVK